MSGMGELMVYPGMLVLSDECTVIKSAWIREVDVVPVIEALEMEVQRLQDLHLERTKLTTRETTTAINRAIEHLRDSQQQCDEDGIMIEVSRQAVHEVLAILEEVAELPDKWCIQMDSTSTAPDGFDCAWDIRKLLEKKDEH
jgi:hypothetical protein